MKVGYHVSPKDACQSITIRNRRWLLGVLGSVGHASVHLTAFTSVACRTIVVPWLLLGFK